MNNLIKFKEKLEVTIDFYEKFQELVDNSNNIFWIVDLEKGEKIDYVSPAFEKIWGYSPNNLYKNPDLWLESVHKDERAKISSIFKSFLRGKGNFNVVFRIVSKDQKIKWIKVEGSLIKDRNNEIKRAVGVAADITNEREFEDKLLESKTRLELATKAAKIGIWEWDFVKNKLTFDKMMYTLYGINSKKFPNPFEGWNSVMHPEDLKRANKETATAISKKKKLSIVFRVVKNNRVRYIESHGEILRDNKNKALKMLGVAFEVTKEEAILRFPKLFELVK